MKPHTQKTHKQWIRITKCENIPLREGRAVKIAGREIAVFNLGDRFLAVDNRCPHNGGPLADGIVSGTTVVCPLHAWKVDLECGSVTTPANAAACVRTFQTRVQAGVVLLEASALKPHRELEPHHEKDIPCHSAATTLQPMLEPAPRG